MCIVVTDDLHPAGTKLLTARIGRMNRATNVYMTLYSNEVSKHRSHSGNQAMIVPFPFDERARETGGHLMVVETASEQSDADIFNAAATLVTVPSLAARSYDADTFSDAVEMENALPIVRSGGYVVTLAPSFAALKTMVQWTEFSLPSNFEALMADVKRRYGKDHGFVVAQPKFDARTGRMGGAFGWIWYGPTAMLPTAHELQPGGSADYDVEGWIINDYTAGCEWETNHQMDRTTSHSKVVDPGDPAARRLVQALKQCTSFPPEDTKHRRVIDLKQITHATAVKLKGRFGHNAHVYSIQEGEPDFVPSPGRGRAVPLTPHRHSDAAAQAVTWRATLSPWLKGALVLVIGLFIAYLVYIAVRMRQNLHMAALFPR